MCINNASEYLRIKNRYAVPRVKFISTLHPFSLSLSHPLSPSPSLSPPFFPSLSLALSLSSCRCFLSFSEFVTPTKRPLCNLANDSIIVDAVSHIDFAIQTFRRANFGNKVLAVALMVGDKNYNCVLEIFSLCGYYSAIKRTVRPRVAKYWPPWRILHFIRFFASFFC